jgi:hypothetical protein
MEAGDIVKVEGVSQKGKSRIVEHGDEWKVVFINRFMGKVSLKSTKTDYIRWVNLVETDKDFLIK